MPADGGPCALPLNPDRVYERQQVHDNCTCNLSNHEQLLKKRIACQSPNPEPAKCKANIGGSSSAGARITQDHVPKHAKCLLLALPCDAASGSYAGTNARSSLAKAEPHYAQNRGAAGEAGRLKAGKCNLESWDCQDWQCITSLPH